MQRVRRGTGRRLPWWALVATLVAGFASNASAATIGQTGGGTSCIPSFVIGDTNYVVPASGGTITSFSFASDASNTGQQVDFLVLRPGSAPNYTVVGRTGLVTLAGTGLETFTTSVTARAGDILGIWEGGLNNCAHVGGDTTIFSQQGDPATGATVALPGSTGGENLNEAANLVTTGLALGCSPASVHVGQAATCTATYTGATHPTGTVTFATNASGTFSSPTCTLVLIGGNQARCSVTYTPNAIPPTSHKIYANYSGDAFDPPAHTSTTINVHL